MYEQELFDAGKAERINLPSAWSSRATPLASGKPRTMNTIMFALLAPTAQPTWACPASEPREAFQYLDQGSNMLKPSPTPRSKIYRTQAQHLSEHTQKPHITQTKDLTEHRLNITTRHTAKAQKTNARDEQQTTILFTLIYEAAIVLARSGMPQPVESRGRCVNTGWPEQKPILSLPEQQPFQQRDN